MDKVISVKYLGSPQGVTMFTVTSSVEECTEVVKIGENVYLECPLSIADLYEKCVERTCATTLYIKEELCPPEVGVRYFKNKYIEYVVGWVHFFVLEDSKSEKLQNMDGLYNYAYKDPIFVKSKIIYRKRHEGETGSGNIVYWDGGDSFDYVTDDEYAKAFMEAADRSNRKRIIVDFSDGYPHFDIEGKGGSVGVNFTFRVPETIPARLALLFRDRI